MQSVTGRMAKSKSTSSGGSSSSHYEGFRHISKVLTRKKLPKSNRVASELNIGYDLAGLRKNLEAAGFRRISENVLSGTFAIVLEGNDDQMIRISSRRFEADRPKHEDFLQPSAPIALQSKALNANYRVEVFPKVDSLHNIIQSPELCKEYGLTDPSHDAEQFILRLMADNFQRGFFFFDPNPDNIGIIKDRNGNNVPVIIDSHAIVELDNIKSAHYDQLALHMMYHYPDIFQGWNDFAAERFGDLHNMHLVLEEYIEKVASVEYPTPLDYTGAQEAHLEKLGLEKGKIKGVLNTDQLEQTLETFESERMEMAKRAQQAGGDYLPDDAIYSRALNSGVPLTQFSSAVVRGADRLEHDMGERFVQYLRDGNQEPLKNRPGLCHNIERVLREEDGVDIPPPGRGRN